MQVAIVGGIIGPGWQDEVGLLLYNEHTQMIHWVSFGTILPDFEHKLTNAVTSLRKVYLTGA